MKPNSYLIISECVERGVERGWSRAHKHKDNPSEDMIKEQMELNIMNEICEYFKFDEFDIEVDNKLK